MRFFSLITYAIETLQSFIQMRIKIALQMFEQSSFIELLYFSHRPAFYRRPYTIALEAFENLHHVKYIEP